MDNEQFKLIIKGLVDRIERLENKRIFQQDIMPDVVKMRHISEGIRFVRSGLAADLPTAETPLQGSAIYYAKDTDMLYLWDGTAWQSH